MKILKKQTERNYTVHTYKEAFAEKIYAELPGKLFYFKKLAEEFKKEKEAVAKFHSNLRV